MALYVLMFFHLFVKSFFFCFNVLSWLMFIILNITQGLFYVKDKIFGWFILILINSQNIINYILSWFLRNNFLFNSIMYSNQITFFLIQLFFLYALNIKIFIHIFFFNSYYWFLKYSSLILDLKWKSFEFLRSLMS